MDRRKSFRLNPLLLASSGSHHNNNHLSSSTPNLYSPCSTLFRFFSDRTLNEREPELPELVNKETTFGDGKGNKSDQSNGGGVERIHWFSECIDILLPMVLCLVLMGGIPGLSGYSEGVEEKNKARFEEFKVKVLEPGLVSKIVVDQYLALVYLKNNTKFRSAFDHDQPIEKGVYLLGIKSPESFKEKLNQTQKILRLDPVPVIDLPQNYPPNRRRMQRVFEA